MNTNWLENRAQTNPDQVALIVNDQFYTFQDLYSLSKSYLSALFEYSTNLKRVAILLPNGLISLAIINAISMSHIELVLLNTRLTAAEIQYQLDLMEVELLISHSDNLEVLEQLQITQVLIDSNSNYNQLVIGPTSQNLSTSQLIPQPTMDDILCYVFTSGTTGRPKSVPLSYSNFYHSAQGSASYLGTNPTDVWLLTMPMYHLGGLSIIFRSLISGFAILCHTKFVPEHIIADLTRYKITIMSLVPVMLQRLIPLLPAESSIRFLLIGGAKTPDNLIKEANSRDIPLAITYGMTETCSQFATASPSLTREKPGTVGKPLGSSTVRIFNQDSYGAGEIGVQGPNITLGYYNVDTQPFKEGYFLTGDIGFMDEDGDLFVLDRRNDLIVSGGENIYPSEIERVLLLFPEISGACVIGIDSDQWGQRPVGFLEIKGGENEFFTAAELIRFCQQQLASYKVPDTFYIIQSLPRTSSGKIRRSDLREIDLSSLSILK